MSNQPEIPAPAPTDTEPGEASAASSCSPWGRIKRMCAEMGDSCQDEDQLAGALIDALLCYRRMCAGLQSAVQRHGLGLGGEKIDELVIAELDRLSEENARNRLEAAVERDKHCHPDHGGHLFSWENAKRIHGGAGLPKQPETPTPLDGASC